MSEIKLNWLQQLKTNGFIKTKKPTSIRGWIQYKLYMIISACIMIVATVVKILIDKEVTSEVLILALVALLSINALNTADLRILEKKFEERE
jgi:hypothetical protein